MLSPTRVGAGEVPDGHQGLGQQTRVPAKRSVAGMIITLPILAGLHHDYRRVA
jgi:hypothetical protein